MQQKSRPLVSAIVPTYNGAATIREALDGALSQTYDHIEIIVVDDASTDDTVAILEGYGNKITLIKRKVNSGVCGKARADATAVARGEFWAYLDQDDVWDPSKIEKQVEFMVAHPNIPICHHYARLIDDSGKCVGIRHEGTIPATGMCARELIRHCFITVSTVVARPEAIHLARRTHGNKDSNSDLESWLTILKAYPAGFGFIPEVLGAYRRWGKSMSRQNWKWGPSDVNALDRVYNGLYWVGLMPRTEIRRTIFDGCITNAEHWRHEGYPDRSLYFALHSLRYQPLGVAAYVTILKVLARPMKILCAKRPLDSRATS